MQAETDIATSVKESFPEDIVEASVQRKGRIIFKISRSRLLDVAKFLRDRHDFNQIASVAGVDYPDLKEFELVYHVWSTGGKILVALKTSVPWEEPKLPTITSVWKGAEFHEREVYEMLGVTFEGHPDLRGILLPEDWNKPPPHRKDFKLPKEPQ